MDTDKSELVRELAKARIDVTRVHYNEANRRVVIEFPSSEDGSSLLNIIAKYVPDNEPLYNRIFAGRNDALDWQYFIRPYDVSSTQMKVDSLNLNWKPSKRYRLVVYLRLPPEDLSIILGLVRDFNAS